MDERVDQRAEEPSKDPTKGGARSHYIRPELVEFGSVNELTRGASTGNCTDGAKRRFKALPC